MGHHCTETAHEHGTVLYPPGNDIWWLLLEICSNLFTSGHSPNSANIRWLLKHTQSAQAGGMHPTGMLSCCV